MTISVHYKYTVVRSVRERWGYTMLNKTWTLPTNIQRTTQSSIIRYSIFKLGRILYWDFRPSFTKLCQPLTLLLLPLSVPCTINGNSPIPPRVFPPQAKKFNTSNVNALINSFLLLLSQNFLDSFLEVSEDEC